MRPQYITQEPHSDSTATRFWEKVQKTDTCWLWTAARQRHGYGIVRIGGRNGHTWYAHRFAYLLTYGAIPEDMHVRHSCDNPSCVNPAHLSLGTVADNMRDRGGRNRSARGESAGRAKLTVAQVLEIRSRYAAGNILYRELAADYGVSERHIGYIVHGKSWKHVE